MTESITGIMTLEEKREILVRLGKIESSLRDAVHKIRCGNIETSLGILNDLDTQLDQVKSQMGEIINELLIE